ncbi:hypothetical protein D3C80_1814900 [compost metagenome]
MLMPHIIDIHGMDIQEVRIVRGPQIFSINKQVTVRIMILEIKNTVLNRLAVVMLMTIRDRVEWSAVVQLANPMIRCRCRS